MSAGAGLITRESTSAGEPTLAEVAAALARIEKRLDALASGSVGGQGDGRRAYTIKEFAELVGRDAYTCREWCREGRINATKRACGRGRASEWTVSSAELVRYRNEGLLPAR